MPARSARPSRLPSARRRLRASFATIASSQGRNGAPRRKRGSARQAFVSPTWAASSASAALRAIRYAVRKAISSWSRTSAANAAASPPRARSTSSSSVGGRLTTRSSYTRWIVWVPMARAVGINHIALEVGSLDEALAFYGRLFDVELRGRIPGMAFIDMGDQFLALAERSDRQPDRERHFGLVVDDRDAVLAAAREAGVEIFGGNSFLDPWGNHVQVVDYARHPVHEDAGDPARDGPRAREVRVGAARSCATRVWPDRPPLTHDLVGPARAARGGHGDARARPEAADPVPDPARARRPRARIRARAARDRPAARPRPRRRPAAAPLRGRVLHLAARPAREPPARRSACGRARPADDRRRRRRRARDRAGPALGGRLRARRGRLPHRPDRRDGDHAPARRPAPDRRTSSRARASSTTAPRSSRTASPSSPRSAARSRSGRRDLVRAQRRRRHRGRARRRLDRPAGAPPARLPGRRGDDLPAHGLFRLHPGRADRRLRGDRGRDGGRSTSAGTRRS